MGIRLYYFRRHCLRGPHRRRLRAAAAGDGRPAGERAPPALRLFRLWLPEHVQRAAADRHPARGAEQPVGLGARHRLPGHLGPHVLVLRPAAGQVRRPRQPALAPRSVQSRRFPSDGVWILCHVCHVWRVLLSVDILSGEFHFISGKSCILRLNGK